MARDRMSRVTDSMSKKEKEEERTEATSTHQSLMTYPEQKEGERILLAYRRPIKAEESSVPIHQTSIRLLRSAEGT